MKHIFTTIFISLLSVGLLFANPIELSNEKPTVGEEVTVTLEAPSNKLLITYRPNSAVAKKDSIMLQAAGTSFNWTPKNPGVVSLAAGDKSRNVSVYFAGISWSGIFTMLLAGCILFGGIFYAFRLLFQDAAEDGTLDLDPSQLPDT